MAMIVHISSSYSNHGVSISTCDLTISGWNACFSYEIPVPAGDDPETVVMPVYMRETKLVFKNCIGF